MTGSAPDDELGHITSAAQLGSLLRRLRGKRTQQNIADHARRQHLYLHRPDLSAIERGHRLPTANELRGILYGCGRLDLLDRLDCIRQQLMAEPADPAASNDQHQPVVYQPAAKPGTLGARLRGLDRGRRRLLVIVVFTAVAVVITTTVVLASRDTNTSTQPLDTSYGPGGGARTTYERSTNHYQIYDTKSDHRAVAVIFYRPDRPSEFVGFQSCHEGADDDCPGDLPESVTGPLCMKTGVGLGSNPNDYKFGEQVCITQA